VATQVPPADLELPRSEQRHEPLAFFSGSFTGAMRRWAIIEKQAYAIVVSCERLYWLLQRPDGFSLFTDHNNLVYVFHPYDRNSTIATHTAAKLIRWALRLSTYRYTIEHVPGDDNVWADIFTRWAAPRPLPSGSWTLPSTLMAPIQCQRRLSSSRRRETFSYIYPVAPNPRARNKRARAERRTIKRSPPHPS
jgi:RNase H-like domain found in reverse transcriptase